MTASPTTRARARWGWALRLAVSALVLGVIFYLLPVQEVVATARKIDLADWLLALAVFLAGHVVSAAKWQLLADSGAGFPAVLRAHFGGLVANLALPGVAGGDVVRAAILYRVAPDKARLGLGSLADRLIDTIGLLLIAAAGLLVALREFDGSRTLLLLVGALLVALVLGIALAVRFHAAIVARLPAGGRSARIAGKLAAALLVLSGQRGRLALCLVLSIGVQSAFIAATIGLAQAAGVNAPIAAWYFAWPLAKLIATLPISMAGLGVREASLAGFLAPFGAPAAAVVAIGLLWQSILFAGGLIGALVLTLSERALRARATSKAMKGEANGWR